MAESFVQLPPDGAGKMLRTWEHVVGANTVHEETFQVTDGAGNIVDPRTSLATKATTTTHNAIALNVDDTDFASAEIDCSQYYSFLLGYDITEVGVLVNNDRVRLRIQLREAGGTWKDYYNGPFGALYEEESTTPCDICVSGVCWGERIRLVATTDYTNVAPVNNHFVLSAYITLVR